MIDSDDDLADAGDHERTRRKVEPAYTPPRCTGPIGIISDADYSALVARGGIVPNGARPANYSIPGATEQRELAVLRDWRGAVVREFEPVDVREYDDAMTEAVAAAAQASPGRWWQIPGEEA